MVDLLLYIYHVTCGCIYKYKKVCIYDVLYVDFFF